MKAAIDTVNTTSFSTVFTDFKEITQARLAVSVVFSSIGGYFLGAYEINLVSDLLNAFGGVLYGRSFQCIQSDYRKRFGRLNEPY